MPSPSPFELLHHHLQYEFDMLRGTYRHIDKHTDAIVANAVIESFCVHARTLFEFFEKDRGAKRYAANGYTPFKNGDVARRGELVRKLNNQVAHLLDGRTANNADKIGLIDQADMLKILSDEFAVFQNHLLPEHAIPAPSGLSEIQLTSSSPSATGAIQTTSLTIVSRT